MTNYPTYKLGEICYIVYGKGFPTKNLKQEGFPVYGANGVIGYNETYLYEEEQVLISCRGAYSGKINRSPEKCWVTNNSLVIIPNTDVCKDFLYYALQSANKEKLVTGTAQPQVTINNAIELQIPLPPLATQRAIVTRIETLFAELDKGVEKLKTAQQQLKAYRQAVLNDAYDGNLTIEWRKNNHIDNNTWKEVTFAEIAEIKCNLVDVNDYGDFPHIAPDNIEKESGRLLEYHTVAEDGVISGKHRFFSGQILYSKIRPNLSKVVIADFDGLCSADMYPIEAKENTKFLFYQMLSSKFVDYASNSGSRTVLPKINQKSLSIIPMKVCTLPEQQRIVQEIETRLSACDVMEKNIAESLQQSEALRQSILKKAFSGELV